MWRIWRERRIWRKWRLSRNFAKVVDEMIRANKLTQLEELRDVGEFEKVAILAKFRLGC